MSQNSCQPEGLQPESAMAALLVLAIERLLPSPGALPSPILAATHTCFMVLRTLGECHIDGLTGMQLYGVLRRGARLDQVDELRARVAAVNHRRRVFGLRRDESDLRAERRGAAVA